MTDEKRTYTKRSPEDKVRAQLDKATADVAKAEAKVQRLSAELQQAQAQAEAATYDRDTLANHPLLREQPADEGFVPAEQG